MSKETKVTAVEWLIVQMQTYEFIYLDRAKIIQQAQAMEKQQIIDAHDNGKNILPPNENGEQYYTDTYKP